MAKKQASAALDRGSQRVNLRVSPAVMGDFKSYSKTLKDALAQLGCPACCSGFDIRFETERTFVRDAKGLLRELG